MSAKGCSLAPHLPRAPGVRAAAASWPVLPCRCRSSAVPRLATMRAGEPRAGCVFAINLRAARACPARPRGRFGLKRRSTQSPTSPGQPPARQTIAAPGAFWRPVFAVGCTRHQKNCAHAFPQRPQAATLAPKPRGPVLETPIRSGCSPHREAGFCHAQIPGMVRLHSPAMVSGGWPQR